MCHKLTVDGVEREHYFAHVRWFKKHPHPDNAWAISPLVYGMAATLKLEPPIAFCQSTGSIVFLLGLIYLLMKQSSWQFVPFHVVLVFYQFVKFYGANN